MLNFPKKILKIVGIDRAIAFTILTRLIQALGGFIAIFFITKYLSGNEQGYYYTFGSIIAIQIFFELGLSGIITQFTAHEFAHLSWGNDGELKGDDIYKSRLSSLLYFCVKWFGILSFILFFILLGAGYYFFSKYNVNAGINWQKPWIILCLTTSLNLFIDPILAFYDGLGEVKDMAKVRLLQKIANIIFLFGFFALGFKLYSAPLASVAAITLNYFQIFLTRRFSLLKSIWKVKDQWVVNYMKEIFPLQWRIGVSWISGYFIFQLFNPVLFATEGPVVAGQMGMTLAVLGGVSSMAYSWINTKVPLFSSLVAKKEYQNLDVVFNKSLKDSTLICLLGLVVFVGGVYIFQYTHIKYGSRFLPIILVILLSIATLINQVVYGMATYLRCHKQEPFLVQSIVLGVLACSSTLIFGKLFGVYGIVIGYSSLIIFICLTWSTFIFVNKKKEWHNLN